MRGEISSIYARDEHLILALVGVATACTTQCSCESGFRRARGVESENGFYCMQEFDLSLTYSDAKSTCQNIESKLPMVNSEHELAAWSDITGNRLHFIWNRIWMCDLAGCKQKNAATGGEIGLEIGFEI